MPNWWPRCLGTWHRIYECIHSLTWPTHQSATEPCHGAQQNPFSPRVPWHNASMSCNLLAMCTTEREGNTVTTTLRIGGYLVIGAFQEGICASLQLFPGPSLESLHIPSTFNAQPPPLPFCSIQRTDRLRAPCRLHLNLDG